MGAGAAGADAGGASPRQRQADTLLSDLQATALRSATGVHWELGRARLAEHDLYADQQRHGHLCPGAARTRPPPLLPDAVNYLMAHRQADGAWGSTYESAWVMLAMTEVMRGTGELGGNFAFGATLNGASIAQRACRRARRSSTR